MWQANVTINNNTDYNIGIKNNYNPFQIVEPNGSYTWNTDMTNNSNALYFFKGENQPPYYMQGGVSFGPESGVYVDRGWMADNDQTISMTAIANDNSWTQTSNGGKTLLKWNEFENGGNIDLTFNKQ